MTRDCSRAQLTTGQSGREGPPEGQTGCKVEKLFRKDPPEVPAKLAVECVTKRLPPSVESYLDAMEHHSLVVASTRQRPPEKPQLTPEQRSQVSFELAVLEQILAPSHTKGAELALEVYKFLARFPFGLSHDESAKQLKLDSWCEDLETYPLYAVKRALGYWRRNSEKEPTFSEVVADVKLFTGDKVLERKRLLERLA